MLIQDNTVLEGKLPHFGGKTTLPPGREVLRPMAVRRMWVCEEGKLFLSQPSYPLILFPGGYELILW